MVILGGAGSMAGVVLGAILVNVLLEVLREPGDARWIFYVGVVAALVAVSPFLRQARGRAWWHACSAFVLVGAPDRDGGGATVGGGRLAGVADAWVVIPSDLGVWAPISYVTLVAAALLLTTLKGWTRLIVLIPTLYLAAFVWENVMLAKPEPTRYILLGAVLVTLMVARPQGLLGEKRVEIV